MRSPRSLWILLAAQILLVGALNLFGDWTLESMPVKFAATGILAGSAFLGAASLFQRIGAGWAHAAPVFWAVTLLLRLLVLPLPPGDDLWRYQWEGRIQHAGFNPYVTTPDDPAVAGIRDGFPAWEKINHRDYSAIYPPGAQLVFAGLARLSDNPLLYKLLFAVADLGVVLLLLKLTRSSAGQEHGSGFGATAWYAWNPLVVYSFAGAAHFDSLMLLPMTAGLLFLQRFSLSSDEREKWLLALATSTAFGVAISMKLVPLLLLPLCAFALGARAICLGISGGIPAVLSLLYGWPQVPIWQSLRRFAYVTRVNDLFWWLVESTVWANPRQKNYHYNVVLILAVVLLSILFVRNWRRGMLWVLGATLIFSPVLHPWYCTWILPVASWRGARAWHVLSVSLFAYFLFWNERLFLLPWHAEPWMRALIIAPPVVAAGLLLGGRRRPA